MILSKISSFQNGPICDDDDDDDDDDLVWNVLPPPPEMNERPLKKGPFQKEISSSNISNHQFSRDTACQFSGG